LLSASHLNTRSAQDALSASVLKVLLYYDLFRYPLTAEEISQSCQLAGIRPEEIRSCLDNLCQKEILFRFDEFYSVKNDPALIKRRKKGNALAEKMMRVALQKSKFIGSFPYVRSVCVSGSLSKKYFDETTDIDFFIITAPNRLWVCRSLLILYKKIFLLNSKKYFCVNYFIDSDNLEIPDKNIFTSTELVTLIPLYDTGYYEKFLEANGWVKNFYPNSVAETPETIHADGWIKRASERLLNTWLGEWMDRYFYKVTSRHWRKKFPDLTDEQFELNLRSRKDVSKHHPQGFQFRVLKGFEENCRAFQEKHQVYLY
jgi:hypothetical protein